MGFPYFDMFYDKEDSKNVIMIQNILNVLLSQGYDRIFFKRQLDAYNWEWVKYQNDNFRGNAEGYNVDIRIYF
jgi:hypothetical protein